MDALPTLAILICLIGNLNLCKHCETARVQQDEESNYPAYPLPPLVNQKTLKGAASINFNVKQRVEFDITLGNPPCNGASITHQNREKPLLPSCHARLSGKDLHKDFVAKTQQGFGSLYLKTSDMCGTELFTREALDCSETNNTHLEYVINSLPNASDMPQRGFGVELELVARDPSNWKRTTRGIFREIAWHRMVADAQEWEEGSREWTYYLLPGVKFCFKQKIHQDEKKSFFSLAETNTRKVTKCSKHSDCHIADYCKKEYKTNWGKIKPSRCKPRTSCEWSKSVDGECPLALKEWLWTTDPSVKPLTIAQAKKAGAEDPASEASGLGFELVSPGPPNVLAGFHGLKSTAEALGVLHRLGIQAGPSAGMHVHVNVGRPWKDPKPKPRMGAHLTPMQILNVWAHYARFQHVIHEMFQDSRVGNRYAYPLLFTDHSTMKASEYLETDILEKTPDLKDKFKLASEAVHEIYTKLQLWVRKYGNSTKNQDKFCNYVNPHVYGNMDPCNRRYPKARYFQLNLVPLNRLGTIEFRGFPATTNPKRALKWVHFITSFVEHYKDDARFVDTSERYTVDYTPIRVAQREASLEDLANEMSIDVSFWKERDWLKKSLPCQWDTKNGDPDQKHDDSEDIQNAWENGSDLPEVIQDLTIDENQRTSETNN